MIFIAAKFRVKPEYADDWPELTASFTEAVRAEPGCLWFDWSRSLDDPHEFVLIEAFRDADASSRATISDRAPSPPASIAAEMPKKLATATSASPASSCLRSKRLPRASRWYSHQPSTSSAVR